MSYFRAYASKSADHQARLDRALVKFRASLAISDRLATEAMAYAHDDVLFAMWVDFVNRRPIKLCGMTIWDMPDHLWRDAYDDGMSPDEAWNDFLIANEEEFNLFDTPLEMGTI